MSERKPAINRPTKPGLYWCQGLTGGEWGEQVRFVDPGMLAAKESTHGIAAWSRDPIPEPDPQQFEPELEPCPVCGERP